MLKSRMVMIPSPGLNGSLIKGGITKMKSIDPHIKSVFSRYRDQTIGIMDV